MTYRLSPIQDEIWRRQYKFQDDKTIEDTWLRIAKGVASVEKRRDYWQKEFYSILEGFRFVPGGRIQANIGTGRSGTTLLNCFVHVPADIMKKLTPDTLDGISEEVKACMKTLASEGGYGTNISFIRPHGSVIKKIGVLHPGAVKYMELWDKAAEIITEGADEQTDKGSGKDLKKSIRKGAMMCVMGVWHPDIEDFINAKNTPNRLSHFNLSVGITRGFMKAVEDGRNWKLIFPDTKDPHYDTTWDGNIEKWTAAGYRTITYKEIPARELWDKITFATFTRNEPGIMFLDVANAKNPISYCENIQTSNPCGEIMMATGVCNLGSLNLTQFVSDTDHCVGNSPLFKFDFDKFRATVKTAVRFLDNINEITNTPLDDYKDSMRLKRRIGLGTMGLGSLHFMLAIRYGSEKSIQLVEAIYRTKAEAELLASAELGREKGNFPLFDARKYFGSKWFQELQIGSELKAKLKKMGRMRNSHHSANAPTGTTAMLAGNVSGGIEPVFMREYKRWMIVSPAARVELKNKIKFPDTSKGEWFETEVFKIAHKGDEEVLEGVYEGRQFQITKTHGIRESTQMEDAGWIVAKARNGFKDGDINNIYATTENLSVKEHLDVLRVISMYTDMNSSKTVNLPANYPFEEFKSIYLSAYKMGIKGLTTYREGTMTAVMEQNTKIIRERTALEKVFETHGNKVIKKLDTSLPTEFTAKGFVVKDPHTKHKFYVNVAFADSECTKPYAIFINTNNKEKANIADQTIEAIEELVKSKGVIPEIIKDQKDKFAGQDNVAKIARSIGFALRHNIRILDIVDALDEVKYPMSSVVFHIKKILLKYVPDGTEVKGKKCSTCGGQLIYQSGCYACADCGSSKCE